MNDTGTLDPAVIEITNIALPRLAPGGGPMPTPAPSPGQSHDQWVAEVALMRARHDSSALEAGALYDAVLREALGDNPLGIGEAPLTRSWGEVPVSGGPVGLRFYTPEGAGPHPVIALVHGGAYWMGGGAAGWMLNDTLCRKLAAGLSAIVVNVDHRLAPEHPFPTPLNDVCTALDWIHLHSEKLGADPGRIAVFGISSGGNLAAAASHRARDGSCAPVAAVVLQCPSVNLSLDSSRYAASEDEAAGAQQIVALYAGGADPRDPEVSPGLRPELSGLAPTLVITADHDPLAADARLYLDRLRGAGVAATGHSYNMTHTVASPAVFRQMHEDTVAWLRGALG